MQKLSISLASIGFVASLILVSNVFAARDDNRGIGMPDRAFARIASISASNRPSTDSGRVRSCMVHERVLQTRSNNLTRQANNMVDVFDAIAKRVEDFYNNKVLPGGQTVANYSNLVADIQTKEATVKTDLQTAQNDAASFNCSSSDPKGQLMTFRQDMQKVIGDLKNFRTSVRNLIVAVRGVVGGENSASASAKIRPATESGENNE